MGAGRESRQVEEHEYSQCKEDCNVSSTFTHIQPCVSGCGKLGCVGTDVEESAC